MKIICITQRPIQTLILIYLLGKKNIFFDNIIYCGLKKENLLNFRDEGSASWRALKYQCDILKIPFTKISTVNSNHFLREIKKIKPDCMISLVVDTIYDEKIISKFKKGIYSSHGGILPEFRGYDCNAWAVLNNKKHVGISLQKISKGVDTGKIVYCTKIKIKKSLNLDNLDKKLYYKFKLNCFVKLVENLKKNRKIKFIKNSITGKQYFSMHKDLKKVVRKKIKKN